MNTPRLMFWVGVVCCLASRWSAPSSGQGLSGARPTAPASAPITLTLKREAQVGKRTVLLDDVASIQGADGVWKQKLSQLDLDEAPAVGQTIQVTRDQIAFRLQAAGISKSRFRIEGDATTVRLAGSNQRLEAAAARGELIDSSNLAGARRTDTDEAYNVPHDEIVANATEYLKSRLPWPLEEVKIRLGQALKVSAQTQVAKDQVVLESRLRSAYPPIGRVQVGVTVLANGVRQAEVPLFFEITRMQSVVVTNRRLDRGETLTAADLLVDRRETRDANDYFTNIDALVGRKLKRSMNALQLLTNQDVSGGASDGVAKAGFVVKRRDTVTMVAQVGALQVTTQGEATQDGAVGDVIRVRNPESNSTVNAKVLARGQVEVQLGSR